MQIELENTFEWSTKSMKKLPIKWTYLWKQSFCKVVQDLQMKKWRSVQLLTSESELEKVADVARRENFWAKKVKKFWGEIFPIDFFSFLDKRSEVLRQRSGNFLFLKSLARH